MNQLDARLASLRANLDELVVDDFTAVERRRRRHLLARSAWAAAAAAGSVAVILTVPGVLAGDHPQGPAPAGRSEQLAVADDVISNVAHPAGLRGHFIVLTQRSVLLGDPPSTGCVGGMRKPELGPGTVAFTVQSRCSPPTDEAAVLRTRSRLLILNQPVFDAQIQTITIHTPSAPTPITLTRTSASHVNLRGSPGVIVGAIEIAGRPAGARIPRATTVRAFRQRGHQRRWQSDAKVQPDGTFQYPAAPRSFGSYVFLASVPGARCLPAHTQVEDGQAVQVTLICVRQRR